LPDLTWLLGKGIKSLAPLRKNSLLFDLPLKVFWINDSAREELLAHPLPDLIRQDWILGQLQIQPQNLRKTR